jgi:RNA polymerase sigma-70 factor (ECF subfamily)
MTTRSNAQWLADLRSPGPAQEAALEDLRQVVLSGLPYALAGWLPADDPAYTPLAEETAQETLLRVLDKLDTFEGRAQFTTWVNKIAVRIALSELRRRRWKNVSLEGLTEDEENPPPAGLLQDKAATPEVALEKAAILRRVAAILESGLTERQREALNAIVIQGMPMDEVAAQMGSNRNALYKLLHDARLRVKHHLAAEGLTPQDALGLFDT